MSGLRIFYALDGCLAVVVLIGDLALRNGWGDVSVDFAWIVLAAGAFLYQGMQEQRDRRDLEIICGSQREGR